ncbi:MAG: DUF2339 domain-containing protein [Planctomycetaceae bacterium]
MNAGELFFVLAIGLLILALPIVALVLSIIAFVRSRRATKLLLRIEQLEALIDSFQTSGVTAASSLPPTGAKTISMVGVAAETPIEALAGESRASTASASPVSPIREVNVASSAPSPGSEPAEWETFVGQKAFGWLAVLLFTFSAAFFLRYAFENNWIGPVGRVAIGEAAGIALVAAGAWYFYRSMPRLSSMATSAGIVVVYLSTYSAFGLYQLMPPSHTGIFLAIIVLESMVAAVLYRSAAVALAAVIGGLLTPMLLATDHDSYRSLFAYLAVLNIGTAIATTTRRWKAVLSVCYLGTQAVFWLWYSEHFHPEKFAWALGFQALLFATYVLQSLALRPARSRPSLAVDQETWENLARLVINALLGFASFHVLLRYEYREWLGTLAISMAALYALVARISLSSRTHRDRLLLTSLALSLGFVAWALPLQANTTWHAIGRWVAMGWAVIGLALWRFGLRISSRSLRSFAAIFGASAAIRLLMHDLPLYVRELFTPIFNQFAFPSLVVAGCLLYAVVSADAYLKGLSKTEQIGIGVFGITGVLLTWIVLSFDCYGYFVSRSLIHGEIAEWRWRGQLALTVLWTVLATTLLVVGFKFDRARLRWLGIGLYGMTVAKLFLVDMANVDQLYRIIGFFVLAVVLGLVARAYQRFK